jgi:hypothetical protein
MMFEMVYGHVPFGEREKDVYNIYKAIIQSKIRIPKGKFVNSYFI